jgi:hypothetical protein
LPEAGGSRSRRVDQSVIGGAFFSDRKIAHRDVGAVLIAM